VKEEQDHVKTDDEYFQIRLEKIKKLKERGIPVYPDRFPDAVTVAQAADQPEGTDHVRTAGRLIAVRKMGKLIFAHIQDISGKLQIAIRRDGVGENTFKTFKELIDIGDLIGVEGKLFVTRTGELTIDVDEYTFLGKSLHPLPEKWHGLTDTETVYRKRYLDLIMSAHSRDKFLTKSKMIQSIRDVLTGNGFIEVETPVLQPKPSGAMARPFVTHHETLDMDIYMRIAPETYLKRLIVGGFTRVFEFARCFRNEGISPEHLQDFTMLEYYAAYWNFEDNMAFTEALFHHVLDDIAGEQKITVDKETLDFSGSWPRVSFRDLIDRDTGIDLERFPSAGTLREEIRSRGIQLDMDAKELEKLGRGNLIDLLYKRVSRPKIRQPVFLVGHPRDLSPLARASNDDPAVTDRFQLVAGGTELVNAYSELADPIDQKQRFEVQASQKAAGDEEAMEADDDFVTALEYGMPPSSGWGMGIDRFLKFLFNEENIKNCVLFPLMRPDNKI
jgi:lysyl-tRNA synthetase, class II